MDGEADVTFRSFLADNGIVVFEIQIALSLDGLTHHTRQLSDPDDFPLIQGWGEPPPLYLLGLALRRLLETVEIAKEEAHAPC